VTLIPVATGFLYPLVAAPLNAPMLLQPFLSECGFLNPILAAAAMALSSVTVLTNAPRLRWMKVG
jgi:Cu+-exporting ATPase